MMSVFIFVKAAITFFSPSLTKKLDNKLVNLLWFRFSYFNLYIFKFFAGMRMVFLFIYVEATMDCEIFTLSH
jgi:hypothetical protein